MSDNKKKNDGALWNKLSRNGMEFMSGSIDFDALKKAVEFAKSQGKNKISISVFKNTYKEQGSNKPDWNIKCQTEAYQQQQHSSNVNVQNVQNTFTDDQDIPF